MLMIDPGCARAFMSAMAPSIRKKGARVLTENIRFHVSTVASPYPARVVSPAALTSPSIRPKRASAADMTSAGASGRARSVVTVSKGQGRARSTGSRSTSTSASAPACAASCAIAAPMPRAAPVISTTIPSSAALMRRPRREPGQIPPGPRRRRSYLHLPGLDARRVGGERHADGAAQGRACLVVEPPVMLGAFDRVVHDEAVGKVHLFVRAKPVGAPDAVFHVAVDREGPSLMVEADHVLLLDLVQCADVYPVGHTFPLNAVRCRAREIPRGRAARRAAALSSGNGPVPASGGSWRRSSRGSRRGSSGSARADRP